MRSIAFCNIIPIVIVHFPPIRSQYNLTVQQLINTHNASLFTTERQSKGLNDTITAL